MTHRHNDGEQIITDKTIIPLIIPKIDLEKATNEKTDYLLDLQRNGDEKSSDLSSKLGVFHQILLTGAVLLLTASAGMPIGYSAVILPQLYNSTDPLAMDMERGSWFASIHSLATPIGSFSCGPLMDFYGRKPALMITIVPFLIGWSLIASASSYVLLIIGRILAGLAVGCVAAPAQVLIGECSEPKLRGILVASPFIAYSFGILVTYSFGLFLTWRNAAWCCSILPIIATLALAFVPESPAWLIRNKKLKKAEAALNWYRCNNIAVKSEMAEMLARVATEQNEFKPTESILDTCKQGSVMKPLVIINAFHMLLITSGTYLVVFYAVDIISDLGADVDSMTAAVLTAVVRLVFTFVTCFLLFYMKRRTLMIGSAIGSSFSTLILAIFIFWRRNTPKTSLDLYVAAVCILIYIGTNTGLMILPGIMIGELLPSKIRGRVAGLIFTAFNLMFFVTAKLFPFFNQYFKTHGLFLMFSLASFGIVFLTYFMLPETKDKTLGEIEDYFQQSNWFWTTRKRKTDQKC